MGALFEAVDSKLAELGCDHSLRFTLGWLHEHACDAERVVGWLRDNGGYCDCEVVANARDEWQQVRG